MKKLSHLLPGGARLDCFLHPLREGAAPLPALIVCPGGGYSFVSPREAEPPAFEFYNMGFQTFVLYYHTGASAAHKQPLEDLARAILFVRENEELGVDAHRVAVMGFSAGGHLAACLGVHWADPDLMDRTGAQGKALRPDALALCYPVITCGQYANIPSIQTISAGSVDCGYWGVEQHVTADTPPTFLWHTMDDALVPVENSMMMAAALHRAGVSCECHLYETGLHGLSVCTEEVGTPEPDVKSWILLCGRWFARRFGEFGAQE